MSKTTGRLPLAAICDRYGLTVRPAFAAGTTITSMTAAPGRACPGCLYVCHGDIDRAMVMEAVDAGAYALLAPDAQRETVEALNPEIPVVFAPEPDKVTGRIAADLNGQPSHQIAVFAVFGPAAGRAAQSLSGLLHVLGYPVGLIDANGSFSQERSLEVGYPLDAMEVQRMLALFVEDGVSAAVVGAHESTLAPGGLTGVSVDVAALADGGRGTPDLRPWASTYGAELSDECRKTSATSESDELAASMVAPGPTRESLSLAISMVMQVGIRKGSIRGALKVAKEFQDD